jgi:hypothetical protein
MFVAFAIVLVLVGLSPFVVTLDGVVLATLVPILVAIGLVLVSLQIEPFDRLRLDVVARPLLLGAAGLAGFVVVQTLPLPIPPGAPASPIAEFAHPVWTSAAAALETPIAGRITVDTGATAIALMRILSLVGVALLTAAVTIDRERAEAVLVGVTVATALLAAIAIYVDLFQIANFPARAEVLDAACLGLVLSVACGTLAFERRRSRQRKREKPRLGAVGLVAALSFLVALLAIVVASSSSLVFAAAGGLATFFAVVAVRRLGLGRWGAVVIGATAIVIGGVLVVRTAGASTDLRLAFAESSEAALDLTRGILADTPLLGTGAGTYSSMVPIYRPSDAGKGALEAATAAARASVELGRPAFWSLVAASVIAIVWLLRGALNRGRDYFYPAAGAASLVTLTLLGFVNCGSFGSALSLVMATILGLAIAQTKGRGSFA